MMNIFMDVAFAQASSPAKASMIEQLLLPAGLVVLMYFFLIRPQQKKQKEHTMLLQALKVGDEVVTSGGIIARIKSISEQFYTLEAGPSTLLKVQKNHISSAIKPKGESK